jgi:hypothetical protein
LDPSPEGDVRQMWLQEAQRRADEIDLGKVQLISSEELEQQVQSLFK